ncbi:hypothetical protein LOK49_LG15G01262 [Camellia lanceoleosa]|uniref:Uncharacterized protein n=1 Tax=Camellia lanceoleosa TaxID=1840588 RepID=A0ACC0F3M6_9ERIC|nr:hypothetical protein LOK49_LG15G01262 [Camellia lanceoleosa]
MWLDFSSKIDNVRVNGGGMAMMKGMRRGDSSGAVMMVVGDGRRVVEEEGYLLFFLYVSYRDFLGNRRRGHAYINNLKWDSQLLDKGSYGRTSLLEKSRFAGDLLKLHRSSRSTTSRVE